MRIVKQLPLRIKWAKHSGSFVYVAPDGGHHANLLLNGEFISRDLSQIQFAK